MTALGVSLLILGAIAVVVESHVPTLGALGWPGVVGLAAGAMLAVAGLGGGVALGVIFAVLLAGSAAALLTLSLHKGVAVQRRRVRSGPEGLVGRLGEVRSWNRAAGTVQVDGGLWRARRSASEPMDEDETRELSSGEPVVVERLQGLTLSVRRAEPWELPL